MIVTVEWLRFLGACAYQVELFEDTFGESVEVTRESLTRAYGAGLNLDWFGREIWGGVYVKAQDSLSKAWGAKHSEMLEVYDKACKEALVTYESAISEAKFNFDHTLNNAYYERGCMGWDDAVVIRAHEVLTLVQAPAATVFETTQGAARRAFTEGLEAAQKERDAALIEVIFNLSQATSTP